MYTLSKHRTLILIHKLFNRELIDPTDPTDGSFSPVFIPQSGTESVPLRRMWLQSCCLAARATETRDQGAMHLLKAAWW